jgi:hypothetical protein
LYSPEIWRVLPQLLADLMNRGRIRVCVFEDADNRNEMVCFGVTGFTRPGVMDSALRSGARLADCALRAEADGEPVFLNRRQVAEANRRDDLRALTFFGVIRGSDVNDPGTRDILAPIMDGWSFFHRGFSLAEIWFEPLTPVLTECMVKTGLRLLRECVLPCGKIARVFRLTRSEAVEMLPNWPAWLMFSPRPRFGFTRAEQQLLELALLDYSDRNAAAEIRVSIEAVKKRWRSIYVRIFRTEPALCRLDLNGADQRRELLHTLRSNLQEIRPY